MTNSSRTILNAVFREGLLSLLETDGFEKSPARNPYSFFEYCRLCDDGYQLFAVRRDNQWKKTNGKLYLDLGLYLPALEKIIGRPLVQDVPTAGCWTITEGLDTLACRKVQWWEIRLTTNTTALADELSQAWKEHANPWFASYNSLRSLADTRYCSAALYVVLGEVEKARRVLVDNLLIRGGDPDGRLSWAVNCGLISSASAEQIKAAWHWPTSAYEELINGELANSQS